jgi:hypothetical protein
MLIEISVPSGEKFCFTAFKMLSYSEHEVHYSKFLMAFDLETLKLLIGIFSIVIGTISGFMALLVEYKDKATGRVTKWGRYALSGLGFSFLLGASNAWVDYVNKSREAQNAVKQSKENIGAFK